MLNINLAIKFGSNEIIIYRKGYGIIVKQPAYIAMQESGRTSKVKAFGKKAEKFLLSQSSDIKVYQPIVNSEIVDENKATTLISLILKDVLQDKSFVSSVTALVAVPCAMNEKQLLVLKKVLRDTGIGKVTFVQNSVCAYANMDIDPQSRIMVVDIGKYLTDISILNEFNFDFGRMYFLGGADMDKSITTFVEDNYNLHISDAESEAIKNEVASLYERDLYKYTFTGTDENNKIVRTNITANEVRVAILNIYDTIFKMINDILDKQPNEIKAEIYNNGILFTGGASAIPGLYEYASKKLELPIIIPEQPMDCVILGAGKLISADKEHLKINL